MKYKRILLKLSGEALIGDRLSGVDVKVADFLASEIKTIHDEGVGVAIVVGGGNIYRGSQKSKDDGIEEETGHYIGMLATVINCLILYDLFTARGLKVDAYSALPSIGKLKDYDQNTAIDSLQRGNILLLAGGTGKPFFSTDSGAALRAAELKMEAILKATKVDGVYDRDPVADPSAKKFTSIRYIDALGQGLRVMDKEAFEICQKSGIPTIVFKMEKGNIGKAISGELIGTIIHS